MTIFFVSYHSETNILVSKELRPRTHLAIEFRQTHQPVRDGDRKLFVM